jgi:hypothetical protein
VWVRVIATVMLRLLCECLHKRGAKNSVIFENSHTPKIHYKQKNFNTFTRWCFDEIPIPDASPAAFTQLVHALMEQDFSELAIRKPAYYSQAFFPFRPKDGAWLFKYR